MLGLATNTCLVVPIPLIAAGKFPTCPPVHSLLISTTKHSCARLHRLKITFQALLSLLRTPRHYDDKKGPSHHHEWSVDGEKESDEETQSFYMNNGMWFICLHSWTCIDPLSLSASKQTYPWFYNRVMATIINSVRQASFHQLVQIHKNVVLPPSYMPWGR